MNNMAEWYNFKVKALCSLEGAVYAKSKKEAIKCILEKEIDESSLEEIIEIYDIDQVEEE